jgi:hypothetical protein
MRLWCLAGAAVAIGERGIKPGARRLRVRVTLAGPGWYRARTHPHLVNMSDRTTLDEDDDEVVNMSELTTPDDDEVPAQQAVWARTEEEKARRASLQLADKLRRLSRQTEAIEGGGGARDQRSCR